MRNFLAHRFVCAQISRMPDRFVVFSSTHFITVALGCALLVILLLGARRSPVTAQPLARGVLAFFCLAAYAYSQLAWSTCDHPLDLENILPFHLCDIAGFLAGYALLTRKPWAQELTYYWGLAATLQALITPAITYTCPHFTFFSFFFHHFAIVGAALFIAICDGWRPLKPWWRSPMRAFFSVNLYLIFAVIMNVILDTNFGYLAHPPLNPSLIDHLGPWPYYILSIEVIALLLFILLTLPWLRKNRATDGITD
jgi:hypothetical integral membrane protein (TIGR02206 family)